MTLVREASSPFGRFLASTGHQVITTTSAEWFDAGPRFFLGIPFHRAISPSDAEIGDFFRSSGALGMRFSAPIDGPGRMSYQMACDAKPYDLSRLSGNTRSKVRRGLKRCTIERVGHEQVLRDGWQAHVDTLVRQGRGASVRAAARQRWEGYWQAVGFTPGAEVWAAMAGSVMAAFLVAIEIEDRVEFLLARSRDDHLDQYPNNALIYHVAAEMLARAEVLEVTFGLEALEEVGPLDEFKLTMGFRRRPLRQRVVLRRPLAALLRIPGMRPLLLRFSTAAARRDARWRKVAGLLRFADESAG